MDKAILLAKTDDHSPGNYALSLNKRSGQFGFWWSNVGSKGKWAEASLKEQTWHHIIVTIDAGHATEPWMKLYFDGKEVAYYGAQDFRTSRTPHPNSAPLMIGGLRNGESSFKGQLDDLRIYNRLLTQEEMDLLAKLR
jgi:hypothetical protein